MAGGYEQVVLNADAPFEEGAFQPRFTISMFKGTEKQRIQQAQYMIHLVNVRNVPVKNAMGILANIFGESTYNPAAKGDYKYKKESDRHQTVNIPQSFGLFQWRGKRAEKMKEWVGEDWETDWKGQLDYFLREHEPWADGGQSPDTYYSRYKEYLEKNPNATVAEASDFLVKHNLNPLNEEIAMERRRGWVAGQNEMEKQDDIMKRKKLK
jgi:hypothetical protein|tara:strand:- start:60 stop:689 length:630 start_codon:yes stop_codon:yes gene_type:complete